MKRLIIGIMAFALVFTTTNVLGQSMEQAAAKFQEAGELINGKKYVEAIPVLEETMQLAIGSGDEGMDMVKEVQNLLPKMYLQKGAMLVKDQKFEDAITALSKAEEMAELYGDNSTLRQAARMISNVYMVKGVESFNSKDYTKALEAFEKGYTQDPQNIKLALYTAQSYAALDNFDKATPIFKSVIDAGAANSKFAQDAETAKNELETSLLAAAVKKASEKDLDGVIQYADMVLTAIPDSPKANLLPVQVANNLKKYDVVIQRGEAAAQAQTTPAEKSDVYLMLGVAYQNKGNNAKALEALKKVTSGSSVSEAKTIIGQLNQ